MGRAEDIFSALANRGVAAIDEFIDAAVSEELFLDFKRSADHGVGNRLHDTDRKNLGEAISGFGNSEGGVIVWGVDCRPHPKRGDVAGAKHPIAHPARFKSWLEGVVSGLTVPPHGGVRHHVIAGDRPEEGFVATLVPRSNHAPHQTVLGMQYYMRAGSSFMPVPHGVLAGMFGRRPQPKLSYRCEVYQAGTTQTPYGPAVQIPVNLVIRNDGAGIAENLFVNALATSNPGHRCNVNCSTVGTVWRQLNTFGPQFCAIASDGLKLAPGAYVVSAQFHLLVIVPIDSSLVVEGSYGCAGWQTSRFRFAVPSDALNLMMRRYYSKIAQKDIDEVHAALAQLTLEFREALTTGRPSDSV